MQVAQDIVKRIEILDRKIAELHAEGYSVEVDRLLEERQEWQHGLDLYGRMLLARS